MNNLLENNNCKAAWLRVGRYFTRAMDWRTLLNGPSFVFKAKRGFYLFL